MKKTLDAAGYDAAGYDAAGYDADGYDADGYDAAGYNAAGYDADGYDADGYDADGYDADGYDADGYDAAGYDADGYNADGYNADGYNADGYNADGYNADGYDADGYDADGYNADGYDADGYNADGNNGRGYNRDSCIGGYHSSSRKLGYIYSPGFDAEKPRVMLGLELEIECEEEDTREDTALVVLDRIGRTNEGSRYALCENDGSLDAGFEIVTGYTGLDIHQQQLTDLLSKPLRGAKSHDTTTCGLHVHVCKANMTLYHAAKLILFINNPQNAALIFAIARRKESRWCAIKDKKTDLDWLKYARREKGREWQLRNLNENRYEALNFSNPKTVEFRLFRGSLILNTVMACLEFSRAAWFFSREASASNLSTQAFLDYIGKPENRRNTHHLLKLLHARLPGYRLPKLNAENKKDIPPNTEKKGASTCAY